MDKIKIISDQFNDGLLSDLEYLGKLIQELAVIHNSLTLENDSTEVDWLAGRLCQATSGTDNWD